jgi:hypothetical protein
MIVFAQTLRIKEVTQNGFENLKNRLTIPEMNGYWHPDNLKLVAK